MKTEQINFALQHIQEILENIRPNNDWKIVYVAYDDDTEVLAGEEVFKIYIEGRLAYEVNVTCDSVLTALSELMSKLAKKF